MTLNVKMPSQPPDNLQPRRGTNQLHTNKQLQQMLPEAEMFITHHNMKVLYGINNILMSYLFVEVCPEGGAEGKIMSSLKSKGRRYVVNSF